MECREDSRATLMTPVLVLAHCLVLMEIFVEEERTLRRKDDTLLRKKLA